MSEPPAATPRIIRVSGSSLAAPEPLTPAAAGSESPTLSDCLSLVRQRMRTWQALQARAEGLPRRNLRVAVGFRLPPRPPRRPGLVTSETM